MRLRQVIAGHAFSVYALDLANSGAADCPAETFIMAMNDASRRSLVAILQTHAERGPLRNVQKSRALGDGFFEFKTTRGDRVVYFYGGERTTILTHGFSKGARVNEELSRARRLRAQWEQEAL